MNILQQIGNYFGFARSEQTAHRDENGNPREYIKNLNTFVFQQLDAQKFIDQGYKGNVTIGSMVDYITNLCFICLSKTGAFYEFDEQGNMLDKMEDSLELMKIVKSPRKKTFRGFVSHSVVSLVCTGEMINYLTLKNRYFLQENYPTNRDFTPKIDPIIEYTALEPSQVAVIGGGVFAPILSYKHVKLEGEQNVAEIYREVLNNPLWINPGEPRGLPMLKKVEKQIQIDNEALLTLGQIFENRGTNLIISPKNNIILDPEQAQNAKDSFDEKYNRTDSFGKKTLSTVGIEVNDISVNNAKLQIIETKIALIKDFANALGLSGTMFEVGSSGYKSNLESSAELSITNGVVPFLDFFCDFFTAIAMSHYDTHKKNIRFVVNPQKAFPELQRAWALYSEQLSKVTGLSLNEIREAMYMSKSDDENADKPMIAKDKIFFEDLQEMTLNNSANNQIPVNSL